MATELQKATAKEYFDAYPTEDVMHITSDGQCFLTKNFNDGVSHQRRIDPNQTIATVYRKEKPAYVNPAKQGNNGTSAEGDNAGNGEGEEAEFPNDTWKKDEIIAWLKIAGVETTGSETKAVLLEMVEQTKSKEGEGAGA